MIYVLSVICIWGNDNNNDNNQITFMGGVMFYIINIDLLLTQSNTVNNVIDIVK